MKKSPAYDLNLDAKWILIDATGLPIGRLASRISTYLKGKHLPTFTPHLLCSEKVVVVNVEKAIFTGRKKQFKIYYSHSGYFGGLKEKSVAQLSEKDPTLPLYKAVERMLHQGPLRKRMLRNLFLYTGEVHPHSAQQPQKIELGGKYGIK